MRAGLATGLALALATQAGCVIPGARTPSAGYVEGAMIASVKASSMDRAEILMTLGNPNDRLLDDRVFGYRWSELLVVVLVPAGYQVGGFGIDDKRVLMIEFAADGRCRRADVLHAMTQGALERAIKRWLNDVEGQAPLAR